MFIKHYVYPNHATPSEGLTEVTVMTSSIDGTAFVAFADQPCSTFTVVNDTGTRLELSVGDGASRVKLQEGMAVTFESIGNANQISVRRGDREPAGVVVKGLWAGA